MPAPKLAVKPPPICSSCFAQYPDRRHVDFNASWDGPVIDSHNGMKQSIDELIVCEKCLEDAAKVIDLVREDELRERVAELERMVATRDAKIDQQAAALSKVRILKGAIDDIKEPAAA